MASGPNVTVNIVGDSSKLSSALGKAAADTETTGTRISGAWKNVAGSLSGAFGSALEPLMGVVDNLGGAMDALTQKGKSVGSVMVGVGGAGLAAGTALQMFGSKEKAADQQLGQAFQNIGANMDDYKGKIEHSVSSMSKFGFTSDQVKQSLQTLVTSTRDPQKAFDLMGTAANLAAAKHEDLNTAVTQLTQIVAGKGTKVLQQLGIQNTVVAVSASTVASATKAQAAAHDKLITAQQKVNDLLKQFPDAADASSKAHSKYTTAVNAAVVANKAYQAATEKAKQDTEQFNNPLKAATGNITAVANAVNGQASAAADTFTGKLKAMRAEIENGVATFGQKYGPAIQGVGAAFGGLGAVVSTYKALTDAAKTSDDGAAAAKVALAAATGEAAVADDGLTASEVAADAAGMPLWATIGLITLAAAALGVGIYELATHWSQAWGAISGAAGAAWGFLDNKVFTPIADWFSSVGGDASSAGRALADGIITGINAVIAAWDWLVGNLKIPGFSVGPVSFGGIDLGSGLQISQIPMFAQGGIVTGPMMIGVGDNPSGREAIVPLEKAGQMGFGGGTQTAEITTVIQLDGREVARSVRNHLLAGTARNARKVGLA